jgi:outer membrane protein OmpA-like peptidoglycan-associated protein
VFNALEEITENTVNDTDRRRVAEFQKMRFEIRGHSTFANDPSQDKALSQQCATIVMKYLTSQGTPAWRLEAKGMGSKRTPAQKTTSGTAKNKLTVDFARTK